MSTFTRQQPEHHGPAAGGGNATRAVDGHAPLQHDDNRPASVAQRALQTALSHSPRVQTQLRLGQTLNGGPRAVAQARLSRTLAAAPAPEVVAQRQTVEDEDRLMTKLMQAPVKDDETLESEDDVTGAGATQLYSLSRSAQSPEVAGTRESAEAGGVLQGVFWYRQYVGGPRLFYSGPEEPMGGWAYDDTPPLRVYYPFGRISFEKYSEMEGGARQAQQLETLKLALNLPPEVFFKFLTPADASGWARTDKSFRERIQGKLDWLRALLGEGMAGEAARFLNRGGSVDELVALAGALVPTPPTQLVREAIDFATRSNLSFTNLKTIVLGGFVTPLDASLLNILNAVAALKAGDAEYFRQAASEARQCLAAGVTASNLAAYLAAAKFDPRVALQCIRLCAQNNLPINFQQWVIGQTAGKAGAWASLVQRVGNAVSGGKVDADDAAKICTSYLTGTPDRVGGVTVIFNVLGLLSSQAANRVLANRSAWPRAFPHVEAMFTGLRSCQNPDEGVAALIAVGYNMEVGRDVLACLAAVNVPHAIAVWVCSNRLANGNDTNARAAAAAFIHAGVQTGFAYAGEAARYVVTGFADQNNWQNDYDYVTNNNKAASLDVVHERFQMLSHAGGNVQNANAELNAPRFDANFAANLLAYGPQSAVLHIANNDQQAAINAKNRTLGLGPRGPQDRPDSHSVVPVGVAGMAPVLAGVLNQYRARIRALNVGEETPPLEWGVGGARKMFVSTQGNDAVEQPWTRLEIIVVRNGVGDAGLILKHCQPN